MNLALTKLNYDDLLFLSDEIERILSVLELQNIKPEARIVYMREVIAINNKVRLILQSIWEYYNELPFLWIFKYLTYIIHR